ncbi:hypothetical protein [Streptomyces sp. NPDC057580]|uniref:hypothetical protein n=1 Tax=Streptomyces sp. NPDC057580 TaxID=3346173 RepID=UPI0036903F4E
MRDLNRLELAGESVRSALEALALAAPPWLAEQVDVAEFAHRYGPRVDGWRMPSSQTKRDRLAQVFGQDALALCRAAWAPDAPAWIREIETVRALRQVLVQTYYLSTDTRGREVIKKRGADDEGVPPGQLRLASPYDLDARWAAKGEDLFWMGYKVHLTETCDTPTEAEAGVRAAPNLITDVCTTDATVPDVKATAPVQQRLAEHGIKPAEHYLDSGYPSADLIAAALEQGTRMVTPVLLDHSAQAKAATGFDKSAFTIYWKARQVRCPAGQSSAHWNPVKQHGDSKMPDGYHPPPFPGPHTHPRAAPAARRMHPAPHVRPREGPRRQPLQRSRRLPGQARPALRARSGPQRRAPSTRPAVGIRRPRRIPPSSRLTPPLAARTP